MSPLFVLSLFSALVGLVGCVTNPSDTAALRAFREQIGDTNNRLSNWNGNDPCGNSTNWEGVFCSPDSANVYHVTELRLLNHNLSGILAPELGNLTNLRILDVMWNTIAGSIPASIGNLRFLELLLLNGNNLSGPLPPELGNLKNMNRIQIDQNKISGPVPPTFGNLTSAKHFHMNNNSLDGNIPSDLGRLPNIVHILLDNNNLSGPLPPELSNLKTLLILQLDNNHFQGSIPQEYGSITTLFKMSLRNCALQGPVPDLSKIPQLGYLDLSYNRLNSTIPDTALAQNITSIDLSNNLLTGEIPTSFTNLPKLQALILNNNKLTGTVNASLIANLNTSSPMKLLLDFQNNSFSDVDPALRNNAANSFNLWLSGNPVCNIPINVVDGRLCGVNGRGTLTSQDTANDGTGTAKCDQMQCNPGVDELIPALALEGTCRCASPAVVEYRLKSPGFTFFDRYLSRFDQYISSGLNLSLEQVSVRGMRWESGPRLGLNIAIFPTISNDSNRSLSIPELRRIFQAFSGWNIPDDDVFGPYEFISFKPPFGIDLYGITGLHSSKSLSGGAIAGIIIGSFAVTGAFLGLLLFVLIRKQKRRRSPTRRKLIDRSRLSSSLKITGVREFNFKEMEEATDSFSESRIAGVGGYGKVYRGVLSDGQVVAIKRAQEGSLQGAHEFYTEIELLSRVHHRNLVALVGFCEDDEEQMLVYEYMEGGTLRERLSPGIKLPLDFATRLRIAIGSARGILYLHTEANPPIFHRDIKASNILLDSKNTAKVADFGLSKLAPIPDLEGITPAHVSTVVKGTPGYLDPEYFLTRKLTDKSDVYSFGVVLLELLTGMHPISQGKNIVREVNLSYHAGMVLGIVDERMGSYPAEALEPLMRLALGCCKEYTDERPSMADVVRDLEDIWKSMPWSDTYSNIEDHEHETGGGGGKKMGSGGSGGGGGGGVGGGKKMSSGGSGAAFNDYFRSSSADTSNNDASGIYSGTIKNLAPR